MNSNLFPQTLPGLSPTAAVALFLQFVPLDGELHDFFKPVSAQILNLLRRLPCLPSEPPGEPTVALRNNNHDPFSLVLSLFLRGELDGHAHSHSHYLPCLWRQPSQLVAVRNSFISQHIPQSLLQATLHLHYLNCHLSLHMSTPLQSQLGIPSLSLDHLIAIAEAVVASYVARLISNTTTNETILIHDSDSELDSEEEEEEGGGGENGGRGGGKKTRTERAKAAMMQWLSCWFACVHLVMEEERDRNLLSLNKLRQVKVIPLASGAFVSARDGGLFFPPDGEIGENYYCLL